MTEHYTRNTESVTAWCAKCSRMTDHRVDGGRRGPCIDPKHPASGIPRAVIPPLDLPPEPKQKNLFEDE